MCRCLECINWRTSDCGLFLVMIYSKTSSKFCRMRLVSTQTLLDLQKAPNNIRNICIMAHVDHGKTTLADSLVASNGIISSRLAGKLRYMDSRKDEQERGITMKSSCIALYYNKDNSDYLVNLIDSPGHVDFSSEVSTAVRLCDGAVVLVDIVEGVCPQTQVALKQIWLENIKPVLVINKIDRLILEMKMSPLDAYIHIAQLLEQVNAVMGDLFKSEVLNKIEDRQTKQPVLQLSPSSSSVEDVKYDWSDGLEFLDDSQLYFTPESGNVVFASAVDGWGFRVETFAKLFSEKLGVNAAVLQKTLWGDFYFNNKTKRIMRGAQEKAKKPLFVQLVLENIWAVYDTVMIRKDKEKLLKIVDSLNIKLTTRDLRHTDSRVQLQALCNQWLPLASSVLDMVCEKLPSPVNLSEERVERLMCSRIQGVETYPPETQALKEAFIKCSSDQEAPVIVFVSKMFPVERKSLPQYRPKALTPEEIALRREQARQRHIERLEHGIISKCEAETSVVTAGNTDVNEHTQSSQLDEDVFIAFARVYSGCLRKGQCVYVLGPKHDPSAALDMIREGNKINPDFTLKDLKAGQHVTMTKITDLYLLMGRELELIEKVYAGNVLGIGGLEEHILKSATLSSDIACPSFSELQLMAVPILRVAVEPTRPTDMASLIRGLKLLNQADACVQVIVQETGEHVLITAGEVHLERCLDDLRERYARVPINVSSPIVPFRETIVQPPLTDMVNEAIQGQNMPVKKDNNNQGVIVACTANKLSTVKIRAVPLPDEITKLLDTNFELIKTIYQVIDKSNKNKPLCDNKELDTTVESALSELKLCNLTCGQNIIPIADKTLRAIETLRTELMESFKKSSSAGWNEESVDQIWSFGPRHYGPNVLINQIKEHKSHNIWSSFKQKQYSLNSSLLEYDSSFVNGFQLASLAGPLCEEPMMGVAFIVEDWIINSESDSTSHINLPYGPLSGQIMSMVKEACRKAFQAQPQRLMAAMYSCSIQVNAEVLGKLYALLGKRQGRVLHGDMSQGSSAFFNVEAVLPVVESFNFASELRKQTSGLASPQLVFSHWEVIEVDPFWEPITEEEYLLFGEKADSENRAKKYMNAVRRRKGLAVDEKIVQFAEKQRTLSKNK